MAAFQMHGIWPMNSEQRRRICYGVNLFLLSCPHLALMAKKCFEFYVLGGWMKMFKTILKPFDSQVMVPYEYISTDIYASKKVTINLMAIYWDQNWPLAPYSNACHMAQRKVTWKPFLQRSISLMAKKCLWSDLTFTSQVRRPILPYAQQASRIRKKKKVKKRKKSKKSPSHSRLQFADDNGELCFLLDSQRSF